MTACRATDNGYVCNKSADHVGEHAARNQFAFDGPILHRWPNAPAPDHGPLAATLSDRTLAKVLSRPAHVPSLVLLDRDEAARNLAALASEALDALRIAGPWTTAGGGPAIDERLAEALADYRAAVAR